VGKQSLVALDTDHIKQYVFATDKLREIRGASSLLDHLNRRVMDQVAGERPFRAEKVYTNGGSGLFLITGDASVAREFGLRIRQAYQEETCDGASITFVVQELPETVKDAWQDDIHETLELLRYRLAERKSSRLGESTENDHVAFPSHPFLYTCDACGSRYAEDKDRYEPLEEALREHYYCAVCLAKRTEDHDIKKGINDLIDARERKSTVAGGRRMPFAWEKVIDALPEQYRIPQNTERPEDFNEMRGMSGGKDYFAIVYADGNSMGQMLEDLPTLTQVKETANRIDKAIYEAISFAISQHLPIEPREGHMPPRFPFDLLLIGGDDIMMVAPAARALDVAISIGRKFHELTQKSDPTGEGYTLSIGVVLAPVKYPFGMLYELAEETLQYAKRAETKQIKKSNYGKTRINFMTVTGSTSQDFETVYQSLHSSQRGVVFYATLRPYTVEELEFLQNAIREGKRMGLGRTKLHQIREAVLKMNLTTSVDESLAVLRNWRPGQRAFITEHVYTMGGRYQERYHDAEQPGTLFPRVTFPWFADGPRVYRTSLLDFVELYDFVEQEGGADEN